MSTILHKTMMPTFRRTSNPGGPTRKECWGAVIQAEDGELWEAFRLEETRTPWELVRVRDGRVVEYLYSSLAKCQTAIDRGFTELAFWPASAQGWIPRREPSPIRRLIESLAGRTAGQYLRTLREAS